MRTQLSPHTSYETFLMPQWNPRPEREVKEMLLMAMGQYYAGMLPLSRPDKGNLPGLVSDCHRLVRQRGKDAVRLYMTDDLAACRIDALPELTRDWLDFRSRDEWAAEWKRFVADWNKRPGTTKIRFMQPPASYRICDVRARRWICANEAYLAATENVPGVEEAFAEWYSSRVKANTYLSISIADDGQDWLVTMSLGTRPLMYDPRDESYPSLPREEKVFRTFPLLKETLLKADDQAILDIARKTCENIDRQSFIHDGCHWPSDIIIFPTVEAMDDMNARLGFTGEKLAAHCPGCPCRPGKAAA